MRVETELLELGGDPFGVVLVGGRANVVRVRGKFLHINAEVVGAGNGAEAATWLPTGASEKPTKSMDAIAAVRFIVPPEWRGYFA